MTSNRYDIVVLGATGFTGQFVVEELARSVGTKKQLGCSRTQRSQTASGFGGSSVEYWSCDGQNSRYFSRCE